MTQIQQGDHVRHRIRGIGTVERIERNAFGAVTRAWVRFRGDLVRVWIDDAALLQPGDAPMPSQHRAFGVIEGGSAA